MEIAKIIHKQLMGLSNEAQPKEFIIPRMGVFSITKSSDFDQSGLYCLKRKWIPKDTNGTIRAFKADSNLDVLSEILAFAVLSACTKNIIV